MTLGHCRLCNPFWNPLGWPSRWRYIVTTRESQKHGDLISWSGMEERSITRRQADAFLSVSEDPVMRQGRRRSPSTCMHHQWNGECGFHRPCRSLSDPVCSDTRRRKHIGCSLLGIALGEAESHGRREADALALRDRPRRQDWGAENPRAHLGQPCQPSPRHGFFRERCRPKVAAAIQHQSRMFLDAVRMRACICRITWCCKRKVQKVCLITSFVIIRR